MHGLVRSQDFRSITLDQLGRLQGGGGPDMLPARRRIRAIEICISRRSCSLIQPTSDDRQKHFQTD